MEGEHKSNTVENTSKADKTGMLGTAMAAFRQVLGEAHVLADAGALARYGWCTIPIQRQIAAVLRPASVEEVQQIVQIATTHSVPLYPISTGNNWGYGSALPVRDDNVVVDLGRLNRIIEVNTELAYVVLEPGVTQRQLYEHLRDHRIPLRLNPTGAGPGRSILGNTLERGFGIGPNGDHFLAQCGMEVVLVTGEVLRTGFGHYPGAKATHVYKWGVGPYLDGLFTQSNYGIVTKMGVWLEPVPESLEACYLTCHSDGQLGPLVDALRQLLFCGVFRGPVNLLHRNRVLIMLGRYPWEEMGGRTPLDEPVARRLAAQKKLGVWNGVGAICGSKGQVQAAKRTIRHALKGKVDRITFLSDKKLRLLQRFPKTLSVLLKLNVPDLLRTLQSSYGLLKGIPSEVALSLAYWRNKRPPSPDAELDPARDHSGLIWFAPIIPMTAADVVAFRGIIEPIFARYGFDACMTFTAVNERCFDCTLPLLYDQDDPNEIRKARQCYAELVEECRQHGYVPYRLGLQSMEAETARDDVFWTVATKLKRALDPDGILAPGRYAR
jgi:4-cresol dehydrogenase (hydroxylating) flavoprotein subunit